MSGRCRSAGDTPSCLAQGQPGNWNCQRAGHEITPTGNVGKRSREPSGKSEEDKQDTAEVNDVESDQQRQRNCVEGTPRRWYGE